MHLRRLAAALIVPLGTVAAVVLTPGAARAAGPCSVSSLTNQGYHKTGTHYAVSGFGVVSHDAGLETWSKGNTLLSRVANYVADGKYDVSTIAGSYNNGNNLGQSGSIGTAPSGGWCANPSTSGALYADLVFRLGANDIYTGYYFIQNA